MFHLPIAIHWEEGGEKNTVKVPKQPEYASSCLKEIMWDMWDYHREQ